MAGTLHRSESRESVFSNSSCISHVGGWKVGDRARIGERAGTIAFIGPTRFAVGEWIGLVLDEATGKNDGSIDGVQYFTCSPDHGLFVKAGKLATIMTPLRLKSPTMGEASNQYAAEYGVDVGDKVTISGGKNGTLRFLGEACFANGVWGGIELDLPQGKNDGSVQGKRYFTCKPLFGIFVPAKNIQKISVQSPQSQVHHNKASILRTELGQAKKTGSRESLNSIGFSSVASSRFGLVRRPMTRGSSVIDESAVKALQKALEEKERHIEQLMAERELVEYPQQSFGNDVLVKKMEDKLKMADEQLHFFKTELASKKKEVDDLRFQLEEENVVKQCEIDALQIRLDSQSTSVNKSEIEHQHTATIIEQQLLECKSRLASEERKTSELQQKLGVNALKEQAMVQELEQSLSNKNKELSTLREQLNALEEHKSTQQSEIDQLQANTKQITVDMKKSHDHVQMVRQENEALQAQVSQMEGELLKKTEELFKTAEMAQTNETVKDHQIREIQVENASLKQTRDKMEQNFIEIEERNKNLQQELSSVRTLLSDAVEALNKHDNDKLKNEENAREIMEQLTILRQSYEDQSIKTKENEEKLKDAIKSEKESVKKEMEESILELTEKLQLQKSQMRDTVNEKKQLETNCRRLEEDLIISKKEYQKLSEELQKVKNQSEADLKEKDELQAQFRRSQDAYSSLQSLMESFKLGENSIAQQLDVARKQSAQHVAELEHCQAQLQQKEKHLTSYSKEFAEMKHVLDEKTAQIRDMENSFSANTRQLEESLANETALKLRLEEELRSKVEELVVLQARIEEAAEIHELRRKMESSDRVLRDVQRNYNAIEIGLLPLKTSLELKNELFTETANKHAQAVRILEEFKVQLEIAKNTIKLMETSHKQNNVQLDAEKELAVNAQNTLLFKLQDLDKKCEEQVEKGKIADEKIRQLEERLASRSLEMADIQGRLKESEENKKSLELLLNDEKVANMNKIRVMEDRIKLIMAEIECTKETKLNERKVNSEQMTVELEEAVNKIRQLNEDKSDFERQLEQAKNEISELHHQLLKSRKEAVDASIEASEAIKKIELAEDMKEVLIQKNINLGEQIDSLKTSGGMQELEFLRKILASKEAETEGLKRQLELALNPMALLDSLTPKKKEIPKRMYCDMCETFDRHETVDCPKQAMDANKVSVLDKPSKEKKQKAAPRDYCDDCEEFDHSTENCSKNKRKKRDYTF